jgi:epoxide hydrolase-like predicted phosphatase
VISTVIFDFGGVISSPLFVGIGAFEEAEGYPKGSLLQLLFGETHYIGVEGRAVAAAIADDPDAAEAAGAVEDEPDWHLLEKGQIDVATYFTRLADRAPAILGTEIDMESYGRFWRSTAPGVHWMVVHKIRELKGRGLRLGLLTNNVKEFGDHWRTMFPLDELFEEVVDSSHVGMRKPERAIYELTCSRMGVEPGEAVFIDDNLDNVEAARAYGMEAVHFGENPWDALAEIEAILERRGTSVG